MIRVRGPGAGAPPDSEPMLGEHGYRRLGDVPEQIGLGNVFRPPEQTPDIAREAMAAGATAWWLRLGIASPEAVPSLRRPGCSM